MARTTATNFTGGLQFPMANAATDLFKKEDVQTLALAVDGHDHSTGKGLVLPAAAIPPITSAMIADGTIGLADLAPGSVDTSKLVDRAVNWFTFVAASTSSPTTTSASQVDLPDMTITRVTPETATIMLFFQGVFLCSVAGQDINLSIVMDGNAQSTAALRVPVANYYMPISMWALVSLAAGTHTAKMQWSVTGGATLTAFFVYHRLLQWEVFK